MTMPATPKPAPPPEDAPDLRHTPFEDAQALVLGTALIALGVHLLTSAGVITGQTAGLAVLLSYLTPLSFGIWFFLLNLPFYWLGWTRMGRPFVVKTVIGVTLLAALSKIVPPLMPMGAIDPWMGSFMAGAVIGMGLIVVFRHGASLGGVGILALYLQERFGIRAGWTQLGFDATLFAVAIFVLDPLLMAASLLGAVVVNLIVAVNHRRDRYVGR
jgi:uncharacterized membrane-anchored protein YitT (DUF2179 family)